MIKGFKETGKCPIGRKGQGNVKTAVVGNEKVIIQIIGKVGNHGKAFAFHHNKSTDHSVVGKAFTAGFGICRNRRQIKIKKQGIVKFDSRL